VIVQIGSIISSREFLHSIVFSFSDGIMLIILIEIYRSSDQPYYYTGNKVLIAICVFSIVVFVLQREYLRYLNRQKEKQWSLLLS
jgi:membrane-bound metal-dependent hydrolase YbcI (DUF457 family)